MSEEEEATPVEEDSQNNDYEPKPIEEASEEDDSMEDVEM